jgi:glyoxylase-like metal-dependent hydrolase (beta-lactamase superfamily II)
VWAHERMVRRLASRGVEVNHPFTAGDPLPGGIEAIESARSGEVVFWLPQQKALVVGDVLLGAWAKPRPTDEPLRMCPERWVAPATREDLRSSLAPLLELPVESVLVSHGEPVLSDGGRALAAALAG